jgi:hypothetical protein
LVGFGDFTDFGGRENCLFCHLQKSSKTIYQAMELEAGLDESQALLDHSSANTTKRYAHGRLEKLKELARNRKNVFGDD